MGSSIMATRVPKKVLQFAGIEDIFTSSRGSKTLGNFVKIGTGLRGSSFAGLPLDALFEILLLCGLVARQQPKGDRSPASAAQRRLPWPWSSTRTRPGQARRSSLHRLPGLRRITGSPPIPR
uniref:Small ribosomal subunit protein uS5 C-terminal domain-containing protein n=1 Tax=Oryza glaberrima TaxID=4538 RepID=I1QA65_ORYGL